MEQSNVTDIIRIAGPEDFQEVFRISCLLHNENGQHPWDDETSKHMIWKGCNRDNCIIGVIGQSNDIKAMIYLEIQKICYSKDLHLVELWNFVRPDCRTSGGYARRLIRFAKKCAEETGLFLLIGIISDTRLEAKTRLYDRELKRAGVFFSYRPESYKPSEGGIMPARMAV